MARAIWSGVLSFGLVAIPVELYSATEAHRPVFHQFEEGTADRIRYQRVNERTGDEVGYANVVKGADIGGGNYVMLDQDELDSVAPGRSRSLDIHTFVDLDEIDAIYFDKTYFLGPGKEAAKPYALLRDAMEHSGKAAIASFVMRGKEYLAAVRADGGLLALETLFFADEVPGPACGNRYPPWPGQAVPARGAQRPPAGRHDERAVDAVGVPRHLHRPRQRAPRSEEEREGVPACRRAAGRDQRVRPDRCAAGKRRCREENAREAGGRQQAG